MVGEPKDLLHALLRSGWYEVAPPGNETEITQAQYLNERVADAVFRKRRQGKTVRNELLLWLSPLTVDGKPVWWAQSNQFFSNWWGQSDLDPDVDDATTYLLQDLWYSQGLESYTIAEGVSFVGEEEAFFIEPFFTTGHRAVLWLSAKPVSMLETKRIDFDALAGDSQ